MIRRLVILTMVLAGGAALAWVFWPRPILVEIATIGRRDITVTVSEEGKARIREVFVVSAPISGQTQRMALHAGDAVVKDKSVVVSIRPVAPGLLDTRLRRVTEAAVASAQAGLGLAQAERRQAEAQLAFRTTELARAERLAAQGTNSETARDKARLEFDTASAALDSAEASLAVRQREVERAQAALIEAGSSEGPCCSEIMAPVSGRILRVLAESEQVVQAGTPLMEIGDPDTIEIVADVLSSDSVEIRPGAAVTIDGWGGPPLVGKVRRVEPSAFTKVSALGIEEQRVPVIIDLVAPTAAPGLGDDFRVVAHITVAERKDVIAAPVAALFMHGKDWAVYRVAEGKAMLQTVKTGRRNEGFAEITAGLESDAKVILHSSDQISEGTRVAPFMADPDSR